MGPEMIAYLQRLELIAFFSGFPIVYLVAITIAGSSQTRSEWKQQLIRGLPVAYGLTGLLFLGLLLRNFYPNYSLGYLISEIQYPVLTILGLASVFFWLPFLQKKPVFCLVHSLIFFSLLAIDFYLQLTSANTDKNILKNGMRVYSDSLILNVLCVVVVFLLYRVSWVFKKHLQKR